MEMIINFEGTKIIFAADIRTSGFPKIVKQMLERKGKLGLQQISIAPYFSDGSRRLFIGSKVNFLDLSGNMYINLRVPSSCHFSLP